MLAAGTTLGPYRILAPIGAGGMGEVYRALDTRLARDVALKVIAGELARDPDRVRRFELEARAAGALSHPNICAIHDVGEHEGAPFVVMELLEGESLRARLARGPIPVRKSLELATQVARGLAAAHAKGIVHRDLKPENLFLTRDGRIVILDFGLAKLTRPVGVPVSRLQTISAGAADSGAILGTVGFMSPEQVRGDAVDHRADVFSLGVVLQEMITGRKVFTGPSVVEVLNAILHQDPAPLAIPSGVAPAGLETLVRRCLEKEPGDRFQDMRDLAFDLDVLARAESGGGGRLPSGVDARRAGRPARALQLAGVGVLGVLTGYFAAGVRQRAPDPESVRFELATFQRGIVTAARFTSDAGSIVCSAAWNGRPNELFESRPGIAMPRPLGLPPAHLLSVSKHGALLVMLGSGRSNYLAQARVGKIAVVPEAGGEPREMADGVASADWAPDGSTIALARVSGESARLEMPPGHVVYRSRGAIRQLRVSPGGDRFAFLECLNLPNFRGSVTIVDSSGRVLARSREWRAVMGIAWSANGHEAWYSAAHDENLVYDIRALSPEGKARVVCRLPGFVSLHDIAADGKVLLSSWTLQQSIRGRGATATEERELGWLDGSSAAGISGDGRTLLFNETFVAGGKYYSACLRGLDASNPVRIGEGAGQSLSPDGRRVLAIDMRTPNRLFTLPTGTGDADSIARAGMERYTSARWMPDGRRVVFFGGPRDADSRTYVQDVAGDTARPVTPPGVAALAPSPDGRAVAGVADGQLVLYSLEGGPARSVTKLDPQERVVTWSADGRSVFTSIGGNEELEILRIELAAGRRSHVATFRLPDPAGVTIWSPVLSPDGKAYAYTYSRVSDQLYRVTGLR